MRSDEGAVEPTERPEPTEGLGPVGRPVGDGESEVPADALRTAVRLWRAATGERWRLVVAAASAVLYVACSLAAPAYLSLIHI